MTSTFDQHFASAQNRLFEVFGVPATYNGTDITVCIEGYDTTIEQYPEVWVAAATIDVRSSEVASPAVGDTVVLDGVTYQVGEIVRRDTMGAQLALTKQMVRI
jgi:hypothetical protein